MEIDKRMAIIPLEDLRRYEEMEIAYEFEPDVIKLRALNEGKIVHEFKSCDYYGDKFVNRILTNEDIEPKIKEIIDETVLEHGKTNKMYRREVYNLEERLKMIEDVGEAHHKLINEKIEIERELNDLKDNLKSFKYRLKTLFKG